MLWLLLAFTYSFIISSKNYCSILCVKLWHTAETCPFKTSFPYPEQDVILLLLRLSYLYDKGGIVTPGGFFYFIHFVPFLFGKWEKCKKPLLLEDMFQDETAEVSIPILLGKAWSKQNCLSESHGLKVLTALTKMT